MDSKTRSIKKYTFKKPDLTRLRELASHVTNPRDFRERHGRLLDLLKVKVEDGILETLVQFYDPICHCFTFPDYQLVPTLEEYSFWVGLPVSEGEPFNGLEPSPKNATIAEALHLKPSDLVHPHFTIKNNLQGLTAKFLYQKASDFVKAKKTNAFESIFTLLIYGLFLFPNMDNFVDLNAIKIFLAKNPVPTLLANTYHSIHHRNIREGGLIVCCAPLLYRWYASHLTKSVFSKENSGKASWSERIMPLTPADIVWVHAGTNTAGIIGSCGEFENVPLIGTCGGITYNPTLAMRQYGYPMKGRPDSLSLSNEFYLNKNDHTNLRMRFVQAWHSIRKFDGIQLGRKQSFAHESYTQWVIDRATAFGMPYTLPRFLSSTVPEIPLPLLPQTKEEYQERLAEAEREIHMWKRECQKKDKDYETVMGLLEQEAYDSRQKDVIIAKLNERIKEKDAALDRIPGRKKKRMDLFDGPHSDFED
ncbi:uncharacterized protein [Medicago truncatula]|uniref:DUF7745 domain-containing protein n=2 Tax=Medicago truncatula TaxID=3880 RepID=G7KJ47_MEDTR|nr:uncharacterized protein LOC120580932 [Medicago truncatula]AES76253.1 hypothetical protein MTR_6g074500 [Medicago truncatula]